MSSSPSGGPARRARIAVALALGAVTALCLSGSSSLAARLVESGATSSTVATAAVPTAYQAAVLADSPRALWELDETSGTVAGDTAGSQSGTYQNGVSLGQPGALTAGGAAASFDGVNDRVLVPDSSTLDATAGVTIEAWVKRSKSSAWQVIVGKQGNGQSRFENYSLWLNPDDDLVSYFGDGTSYARVESSIALDTAWHHVVSTYDNATARIYVDGTLRGTGTSTVQLTPNADPLTIGRDGGSDYVFGGQLDEVAVYGTALSAVRIAAHFAAAGAGGPPPAPTVTGFAPTSGTAGTGVTVSGTNLAGATSVSFNGVSTAPSGSTATSVTVAVPAGATTGKISVTTPGGTATSSGTFTIVPAPTISGFSPTSGAIGTVVTVSGTNLAGASSVSFNGAAAAPSASTSTSVTVAVPAAATTGKISVTTAGGTATSSGTFTVTAPAPSISGFSPTSGPVGTVVTVSGSNLAGASTVSFNGVSTSPSASTATSVTVSVPAAATTGKISVTTPGGTAQSSGTFTVTTAAPSISGFSPTSGAVGTVVTVSGANLANASSVSFNGTSTAPSSSTATSVTAAVPAGATSGTIAVSTPGGTATSSGSFTVTAPPPAAYATTVLADSPRAYWRFEETSGTTAADSAGQNRGTLESTPTLGRNAAINAAGSSIELDGVNDGISVPDASALDLTSGVTIEAWVKKARSGAYQVIIGKSGNGQSARENYSLWLNTSDRPVSYFGNGSSYARVESSLALDGAWHYVVATYDNATARMYVDGVLTGSSSSSVRLTANSDPLLIGRDIGSVYMFRGRLDEVAVYGTALSLTRIAAHYVAGIATGVPDTTAPAVEIVTPAQASSTTDTTPTFTGSAGTFAGDGTTVTVVVRSGGPSGPVAATVNATRSAAGAFSVDVPSALPVGSYSARAQQSDASGNTGLSAVVPFIVVPSTGSDPVVLAAGDIAWCEQTGDEATAALLDTFPSATVLTLGDNAYEFGTPSEYSSCYAPSWGRAKSRTRPALGDHDYADGADPRATGYFGYFGSQLAAFGSSATDPSRGWYSFNVGTWHVVVLNTDCDLASTPCTVSQQESWLRADLASHPTSCTLAVLPSPRFSSGVIHGSNTGMASYWQAFYDYGVELALSGDDHLYERFSPMSPSGAVDASRGIRQFIVGTGGRSHYTFGTILANSEARNDNTFGVIKLTLRSGSFEWQFVPEAGKTFTDAGTGACH